MNSCNFVGNIVRDVELRYLPNGGVANARFTLAIDKGLSKDKKKEFEAQGRPTCTFLNFVAWNGTAETIANYFKKGDKIAVQSSAESGSYTNKEGQKVYTTDFRVDKFFFVGGNNGNSNSGNGTSNNSSVDFTGDGFDPVDEDDMDSIPF